MIQSAIPAQGAVYYVAASGNGSDGSSWANAYTNLQAAVNAGGSGATILIKEGTYPSDSQVVVSNLTGVTISGGYAGNTPEPGDLSASPTIFTRGGSPSRILYGSGSTVTLERITFQSGYLNAGAQGAGLYFSGNSEVTLRNCVVTNNSTLAQFTSRGAGLYIDGGTLRIYDSSFADNSVQKLDWSTASRGGAIYANNAAVTATNSTFRGNLTWTRHEESFGGSIFLNAGQALFSGCTFQNNSAQLDGDSNDPGPTQGGAIYVANVAPLTLSDCVFTGNRASYRSSTYGTKLGGVMLIAGASSRTVLERCVLANNGDMSDESADIYLAGGMLGMTNVLCAGSMGGSGLLVAGGTASVANCTFASNIVCGISKNAGRVTVQSSIAQMNTLGGIVGADSVDYSCAQEVLDGAGNSIAYPLFADTTYYHLKARAGYYSGGYFSGGSWSTSAEDSPFVDAGNPLSAYSQEPQPNGFRANMGAYGNSSVASKSYVEDPGVFTVLAVHTYSAIPLGQTSVQLRGQVLSDGGAESPIAAFCWGTSDAGVTSTGLWENVVNMGTQDEWALFTNNLTGLGAGSTYHHRSYVTNSTGVDWSDDVTFQTMGTAVLTNMGPNQVRRHSVKLQGQVLSNGGDDPYIWIWQWQDGSSSTSVYAMGVQNIFAPFTTNVAGLLANTLYHYQIVGSNSVGLSSSPTVNYSTLSTSPIGRYLTTTGGGVLDGSSWANAYPTLSSALLDCEYPGDTVYVKHGSYLLSSQASLSGLAGAIISGGYEGVGAPGSRTNAATIFSKLVDKTIRIFYGTSTTVTLDRITIEGGYLTADESDGGGLYFTGSSSITLTNCIVRNNSIYIHGTADGVGLYINGGALSVFDCLFSNNSSPKYSYDSGARGVGLCALNATSMISGSRFVGNWSQNRHDSGTGAYGAGIYLQGGRGTVSNCTFESNNSINEGNTDGPGPARGGGLAVLNMNPIVVQDCFFTNNKAYTLWSPDGGSRQGSAMYFLNSTGSVSRCVLFANGHSTDAGGTLYSEGGLIGITNVLAAYGQGANAIYMNGAGSIASVTAVSNGTWGIRGNGTTPVKNSVAWMNATGGIENCAVSYTCSQEAQAGAGNVIIDPVFADSTYFHLSSRTGCYTNGYFTGGTFMRTFVTSPLIDTGDTTSAYRNEPAPNGVRINRGYDGNTPVASLSGNVGTVFVLR